MRRVASVAEVRAADAAASAAVGEAALIARASTGLAAVIARSLDWLAGTTVVVLAGSGHNGADGLWAASRLAARGAAVTVVRSSDREPDEHGRAALAAVLAAGGRLAAGLPAHADVVIDAMVGLGVSGGLHGRAAELAAGLPDLGARLVVAVDVPSGVDADTGSVGSGGAVRADLTVTFDVEKPGLLIGAGAEHSGSIVVVVAGLGLHGTCGPLATIEDFDVSALLPLPAAPSDKYTRGVVGILTGSSRYPGAAVLSVGGAVRNGAGYVRYLGGATEVVRDHWPSVVAGDGRCDAYVVGSGLGTDDDTQERVRALLAIDVPIVLDADGLAVGADAIRGRAAPTLLTPHAGEFQRLTGVDPADDPLGSALRAADDLHVTILLKGRRTLVAAPGGVACIVRTGCPWLSTAGTGDVLGGAAGALMAALAKRGHDPVTLALDAGSAASHLHGLAGWLAGDGAPISAEQLLDVWSDAIRSVR